MDFTIEMKLTVPDENAHVMQKLPGAITDILVGSTIRINRLIVTNDTLVAEEANKT